MRTTGSHDTGWDVRRIARSACGKLRLPPVQLRALTRLSAVRSRDSGGAGLVKRIADQHGAAVLADCSPAGGARLEVRFPAAAG